MQTSLGGTKQVSSPEAQRDDETPVYESIGFIVGITVAVIVVVFIIGAVIMRRSTPEVEQGRTKQRRTHLPYQDPSMWSRPAHEQRVGISHDSQELLAMGVILCVLGCLSCH